MSQVIMCHDSLSKNFKMWYDGVQQSNQSNISQFTKQIDFWGKGNLGPIWAKVILPYVYHSLSQEFAGIFLDDQAQQIDKSTVSRFPKKIFFVGNMDPIWPKITQPYIKLTSLEIFRNIPL